MPKIPDKINEVKVEFKATVGKDVTDDMLDGLKHVVKKDVAKKHELKKVWISSAKDSHKPPSRHVTGQAVDISRINGKKIGVYYPKDAAVKAIVQAMQDEFETFAQRRENFGPHLKKKNGKPYNVSGHDDHMHFSVNESTATEVAELELVVRPEICAEGALVAELPWYVESLALELSELEPTPLAELYQAPGKKPSAAKTIPYDPVKAFAYADYYCHGGNKCGEEYDSDCAHFMAHCLAAGGIVCKGRRFKCPDGLCIRVEELAAHLEGLRKKYSNVTATSFKKGTQRGDYGFFLNWIQDDHSFLLNGPVHASGKKARIYGHTNNRCGKAWVKHDDFATAKYYRIKPA